MEREAVVDEAQVDAAADAERFMELDIETDEDNPEQLFAVSTNPETGETERATIEDTLEEPWLSAFGEMQAGEKASWFDRHPEADKDGLEAWIRLDIEKTDDGKTKLKRLQYYKEPVEDGVFEVKARPAEGGGYEVQQGGTGEWVPYNTGFEGEWAEAYDAMVANEASEFKVPKPSDDTDEFLAYERVSFTDGKAVFETILEPREREFEDIELDDGGDDNAEFELAATLPEGLGLVDYMASLPAIGMEPEAISLMATMEEATPVPEPTPEILPAIAVQAVEAVPANAAQPELVLNQSMVEPMPAPVVLGAPAAPTIGQVEKVTIGQVEAATVGRVEPVTVGQIEVAPTTEASPVSEPAEIVEPVVTAEAPIIAVPISTPSKAELSLDSIEVPQKPVAVAEITEATEQSEPATDAINNQILGDIPPNIAAPLVLSSGPTAPDAPAGGGGLVAAETNQSTAEITAPAVIAEVSAPAIIAEVSAPAVIGEIAAPARQAEQPIQEVADIQETADIQPAAIVAQPSVVRVAPIVAETHAATTPEITETATPAAEATTPAIQIATPATQTAAAVQPTPIRLESAPAALQEAPVAEISAVTEASDAAEVSDIVVPAASSAVAPAALTQNAPATPAQENSMNVAEPQMVAETLAATEATTSDQAHVIRTARNVARPKIQARPVKQPEATPAVAQQTVEQTAPQLQVTKPTTRLTEAIVKTTEALAALAEPRTEASPAKTEATASTAETPAAAVEAAADVAQPVVLAQGQVVSLRASAAPVARGAVSPALAPAESAAPAVAKQARRQQEPAPVNWQAAPAATNDADEFTIEVTEDAGAKRRKRRRNASRTVTV